MPGSHSRRRNLKEIWAKQQFATHRPVAERHVKDLLQVLNELLTVPELLCFEPNEMFDHTLEAMAKARVIRAAVLDEMAEFNSTA